MNEFDLLNHQLILRLVTAFLAVAITTLLFIGLVEPPPEVPTQQQLGVQDALRSLEVIARECVRYNDLEFPDSQRTK